MTDQAIHILTGQTGVRAACDAVGVAQASYYRRHRSSPPPARRSLIAHRDRVQPRALTGPERQAILDLLHSDRFVDLAPAEVWATLLDEGVYLGSPSTFYRLLRAASGTGERRRQATHPAAVNRNWSPTVPMMSGPGTSRNCTGRRNGPTSTST